MSRLKAAQHCTIKPWLSANGNNREKKFIQAGASLFESSSFHNLKDSTKFLYLCMTVESGQYRNFKFSRKTARFYGISESSLRRGVKELAAAGFITFVSGANLRVANEYTYSYDWKLKSMQ